MSSMLLQLAEESEEFQSGWNYIERGVTWRRAPTPRQAEELIRGLAADDSTFERYDGAYELPVWEALALHYYIDPGRLCLRPKHPSRTQFLKACCRAWESEENLLKRYFDVLPWFPPLMNARGAKIVPDSDDPFSLVLVSQFVEYLLEFRQHVPVPSTLLQLHTPPEKLVRRTPLLHLLAEAAVTVASERTSDLSIIEVLEKLRIEMRIDSLECSRRVMRVMRKILRSPTTAQNDALRLISPNALGANSVKNGLPYTSPLFAVLLKAAARVYAPRLAGGTYIFGVTETLPDIAQILKEEAEAQGVSRNDFSDIVEDVMVKILRPPELARGGRPLGKHRGF